MDSAPASARDRRFDRACFAAAFALTLGWFFIYDHFQPDYLVDESGHLAGIYHFLEQKPGWPEHMTMLPGYHYVVVALWKLHPPLRLLTVARLVSTLFAFAGLGAFALAWRQLHGREAGRATLLFALLPILQPFTALAYTDVPALACVLAAFAVQLAERWFIAALAFIIGALVRQTNLLWAAFLVPWEWWRARSSFSGFLKRIRWVVVVLVVAAILVLRAGRITLGNATGTELGPNIATLHCAALLFLLFGLPAWLAHAPSATRAAWTAAKTNPLRAFIVLILALGCVVILTRTFANPHVWNRELFWPDSKFTLLRNWPLVWMEKSPALRVLSSLNIVLMAVALYRTVVAQSRRRELWATLVFGAVMPAADRLVEPRYFIPGAVFFLLFLDLESRDWRRLVIWWILLCALHAPFIARGLSLW